MCREARNAERKRKDIKVGACWPPLSDRLVVASTAEDQNENPDPVAAATSIVVTSVVEKAPAITVVAAAAG